MARKPKQVAQTEGENSSPPFSDTVSIRIIKDGVHDGLGGVWYLDQIAELPRDVADIFIAKNCGVPADGADITKAKEKAAQALAKAEAKALEAGAQSRLRSYDDAPKSIRDLAKEFGDEVVSMWELGKDEEEIIRELLG